VVNAYEQHEHIYTALASRGGTLLLRGTGMIASRILQKIYTLRRNYEQVDISVIHLLRSPQTEGNKYGLAHRRAENNYQFQTFNWPKACWGGQYKAILEDATPEQRQHLLADWGGATTMNRADWRKIVSGGISKGWYRVVYGEVQAVSPNAGNNGLMTTIRESGANREMHLESDFIIDATGVDAPVSASPFLNDLVKHYNLPLNDLGRLTVTEDFELAEMANQAGRIYAAGAITIGNSYAPVDSFLGLQYAAFNSMQDLLEQGAIGIKPLVLYRSFIQWWKWVSNRSPD
jgi:hypothetical protein